MFRPEMFYAVLLWFESLMAVPCGPKPAAYYIINTYGTICEIFWFSVVNVNGNVRNEQRTVKGSVTYMDKNHPC